MDKDIKKTIVVSVEIGIARADEKFCSYDCQFLDQEWGVCELFDADVKTEKLCEYEYYFKRCSGCLSAECSGVE